MSSSLLHWETSHFPNGKAQLSWEGRGRALSGCYQCLLVCEDRFPRQCELGLFRKGINLTLFRLRYQRGSKGIREKKKKQKAGNWRIWIQSKLCCSVPRAWYSPDHPNILTSFIYYFCLYLLCGGQFPAEVKPGLSWVALLLWSMSLDQRLLPCQMG